LPRPRDLNINGLNMLPAQIHELLSVNPVEWQEELRSQSEFFKQLGDCLPAEIISEHELLSSRLSKI
jgi:GTP-dependent phosphoenolpyruvate carboxykinase